MRIIVVDDREEERYLAETLLKASGYEVETAANGMEALEKLRAGGFDMIVSDILMPVMDGFRFCQECKRDEKLKGIPFVFYTATYKDEEDESLSLVVGADRFVTKPAEPEDFVRIIQGLFRDVKEGKKGPGQRVVEEEKEVLKLYSERLVAKLEMKVAELEAVDARRKQALERAEYLHSVLGAIRSVNQLIIKEKDRQRLLRRSCSKLVKTRGFYNAWIAILDESGRLVTHAEAGLGANFLPMVEQLERGGLPSCCQQALRQASVVAIVDPSSTCTGCPLGRESYGRGALATRLKHGKKVYGVLVAYVPAEFVEDEEEQSLFQELAGDIAFALHDMELREENERAQESLRFSDAAFKSIQESVVATDTEYTITRCNKVSERIYGIKASEAIGKKLTDVIAMAEARPGEFAERFKKLESQGYYRQEVLQRTERVEIWVDVSIQAIEADGRRYGWVALATDITERRKAQQRLEDAFIDLAQTMSRAMEARDPYTAGHQRRVAELARLAGERLGLDADRLQGLYIGALLHDIGKISIPESLLSMPRKLTGAEWSLIQGHARQGYEILEEATLPWPVAEVALHHHERMDGSGYPDGISGDELTLEVRIVGVCDVVEAMGSHRPYRPALSRAEIVEELRAGRGTKYDAQVTDILLEMVESGVAELNSGPA